MPGFEQALAAVAQALAALPEDAPLLLAYSGGADSECLLQVLRAHLGDEAPRRLRALHVHHGLSSRADAWEACCRARAESLGIPFQSRRVVLDRSSGDSLEAQARAARYAALAEAMAPGEILLTAHHRDDQAETVLLRLLRGSGSAGLAAMAACQSFGPGWLLRPLLDLPGAVLRAALAARGIAWVEDESNAECAYDRNFLRHRILPVLHARWPGAAASLARGAAQAGEDAALLRELAGADLSAARTSRPEALRISPLLALSPSRERNALRHWLAGLGLPLPSRARLEGLREQLLRARDDAQPCWTLGGMELRRYRDVLHALPALPAFASGAVRAFAPERPLVLASGLGTLKAQAQAGGLRLPASGEAVTVRYRRGGEHCRPAGRAQSQCLKKLLQEAGVPPWWRDRLPLVYFGERLVAVGGVFLCAEALAAADEPGWRLWLEGRDGRPLDLTSP